MFLRWDASKNLTTNSIISMIDSNSDPVELFAQNEVSYLFLEKDVSKHDWVEGT